MTFLNSIFLFGLAAVTLPLLIHLFSRQRVKTISFSTLEFLKLLQRQKMRRVRLRQLILLILRTLIVLFVVLAFARPALRGVLSAGLSARAQTTAVIVVDNSFSMGLNTPRGLLFEQAKEKATEVVELLKTGDEAYFLLVSDAPAVVDHTEDFATLRKEVEESELSHRTTDIRAALISAAELLGRSKSANREIYLITDMQRSGWEDLLGGEVVAVTEGVTLYVIPVTEPRAENVSIEEIEFLDRLLEVGKPLTLRATITNHSDRKRENVLVQLFVSGKRIGQTMVDLEARRSSRAELAAVFDAPGQISGYVELEEDDLPFDDRRYFAISVPEKIRVLIVGRADIDAHYLRLALNPFEKPHSLVLPTVTSVDRLGSYALGEFDVIILANVPRLSEAQLSRLESSVEGGKGVIIFLGDDIDPRFYNSRLLPTLFPAVLLSPVGKMGDTSTFLTFGTIDHEHPIFKGLLQEKSEIESPKFYLIYDVRPDAVVEPIISYSNGKVALAETRKGQGRAVLFSSAADPDWTNLLRRGIYVPLLYRVVQYLATDLAALEERTLVGEAVSKEVGDIEFGEGVVCVGPDGSELAIEPRSSGTAFLLECEDTETPGVHRFISGRTLLRHFAVNVNPVESNLATIERAEVEEVLGGMSVHMIDPGRTVEEYVLRARYGQELWKQFLLVAFLLMCVEMLVARERRKAGLTNG